MTSDATNPTPILSYATPVALDRLGVWWEGHLVVKPPGRVLPPRCVLCNNTDVRTVRATFRYMPVLKLVVKSVYRNIAVPMCESHRTRARRQWWAGVALRAIGAVILIGGATLLAEKHINAPVMGAIAVLTLVMSWRGDRMSQKYVGLELAKIAQGHLYFSGADRRYLDSIPPVGEATR